MSLTASAPAVTRIMDEVESASVSSRPPISTIMPQYARWQVPIGVGDEALVLSLSWCLYAEASIASDLKGWARIRIGMYALCLHAERVIESAS
jgi:hypothetical protein